MEFESVLTIIEPDPFKVFEIPNSKNRYLVFPKTGEVFIVSPDGYVIHIENFYVQKVFFKISEKLFHGSIIFTLIPSNKRYKDGDPYLYNEDDIVNSLKEIVNG